MNWLKRFWDFIDERDIDKHVMSVVIMFGTVSLTRWAMNYADSSVREGTEVALIIAAVCAPYMAMQAAALKWYFDARTD